MKRPPPIDAERLKDEAEGLGLPAEAVAQLVGSQVSPVFKVWPENWAAVDMFWRLRRRWVYGPRGPVGIDSRAIEWLFSLLSVADPLAALEDLDVMQDAYLTELYS